MSLITSLGSNRVVFDLVLRHIFRNPKNYVNCLLINKIINSIVLKQWGNKPFVFNVDSFILRPIIIRSDKTNYMCMSKTQQKFEFYNGDKKSIYKEDIIYDNSNYLIFKKQSEFNVFYYNTKDITKNIIKQKLLEKYHNTCLIKYDGYHLTYTDEMYIFIPNEYYNRIQTRKDTNIRQIHNNIIDLPSTEIFGKIHYEHIFYNTTNFIDYVYINDYEAEKIIDLEFTLETLNMAEDEQFTRKVILPDLDKVDKVVSRNMYSSQFNG